MSLFKMHLTVSHQILFIACKTKDYTIALLLLLLLLLFTVHYVRWYLTRSITKPERNVRLAYATGDFTGEGQQKFTGLETLPQSPTKLHFVYIASDYGCLYFQMRLRCVNFKISIFELWFVYRIVVCMFFFVSIVILTGHYAWTEKLVSDPCVYMFINIPFLYCVSR
jgi:hypothetical protein